MQFDLATAQGKLNFHCRRSVRPPFARRRLFKQFHIPNSLQIADTMEICIKFPYAFVESERTHFGAEGFPKKVQNL